MPTIQVKDATGAIQTVNTIPNPGQDTAVNSQPVVIASDQSEYPVIASGPVVSTWPGYTGIEPYTANINIDDYGALVTRGATTTDEGSFRYNASGNSLFTPIGACTFTNGSVEVNGGNFISSELLHTNDYVKLDADAAAWVQISSIDSETHLTLKNVYGGTGGTGNSSMSFVNPYATAGTALNVTNGTINLSGGTTMFSAVAIGRVIDYAPLIFISSCKLSQRIANQETFIGLKDTAFPIKWSAWFKLSGTDSSKVIVESSFNATDAPSVYEIESHELTLPNNLKTSDYLEYRVDVMPEHVRFYVNGLFLYEHSKRIPRFYDVLEAGAFIQNTGTPSSNTILSIEWLMCKNFDKLEIGVNSIDDVQTVEAAPSQNVYNYISAASTNANVIKTIHGNIFWIEASNNSSQWRYLKIFDKATTPSVGTDIPISTIGLSPSSIRSLQYNSTVPCLSGISFAITNGIANSDTTAISANEIAFTLSYN